MWIYRYIFLSCKESKCLLNKHLLLFLVLFEILSWKSIGIVLHNTKPFLYISWFIPHGTIQIFKCLAFTHFVILNPMVLLLIITLFWDFAVHSIFLQTNSSTFQNISNKIKALWNIVKNIMFKTSSGVLFLTLPFTGYQFGMVTMKMKLNMT